MGKIARGIIVVKEQARNVVANIPFMSLHKQIAINIIYFMVLWLNDFLDTLGISEKHSPREIFTGREVNFSKHCKTVFGSHVEARKYMTITNNMKP